MDLHSAEIKRLAGYESRFPDGYEEVDAVQDVPHLTMKRGIACARAIKASAFFASGDRSQPGLWEQGVGPTAFTVNAQFLRNSRAEFIWVMGDDPKPWTHAYTASPFKFQRRSRVAKKINRYGPNLRRPIAVGRFAAKQESTNTFVWKIRVEVDLRVSMGVVHAGDCRHCCRQTSEAAKSRAMHRDHTVTPFSICGQSRQKLAISCVLQHHFVATQPNDDQLAR